MEHVVVCFVVMGILLHVYVVHIASTIKGNKNSGFWVESNVDHLTVKRNGFKNQDVIYK